MKHGDGSTDDIISPGGDTTTDLESTNSISNLLSSPEFMDGAIRHRQRLGQSLVGDARETSPYIITFLDKIDWRRLSRHKNAISILVKNLDNVVWKYLSENPNAISILENNLDKVNWSNLSSNPNAIQILE